MTTTYDGDVDLTEFEELDADELHLVKRGANGFPALLAKAAADEVQAARLPRSVFALPERRQYRIDSEAHARESLRQSQTYSTADERRRVREAVRRRYPRLVAEFDAEAAKATLRRIAALRKSQDPFFRATEQIRNGAVAGIPHVGETINSLDAMRSARQQQAQRYLRQKPWIANAASSMDAQLRSICDGTAPVVMYRGQAELPSLRETHNHSAPLQLPDDLSRAMGAGMADELGAAKPAGVRKAPRRVNELDRAWAAYHITRGELMKAHRSGEI